jgi:hypothetical protein
MTEEQWLESEGPQEMYFQVVKPLGGDRRRLDYFCLACVRPLLGLIADAEARRAFEWLEENPGVRVRPSGGHIRDLFRGPAGPAEGLYHAHHRRESGVSGRAVHVAYDLWADWYGYAFPNYRDLFESYPGALAEAPSRFLPAVMREIYGNPFRPLAVAPSHLTEVVRLLAQAAFESREVLSGHLDNARLAVLSDALEEAGCTEAELLGHLRSPGPHVRGCWAVDLILGKS